jgi:hypothetical protein
VKNRFGKNLFVKQVQVPWPEPDQIDEENSARDDQGKNNSEKILQDELKHGAHNISAVPALRSNRKFGYQVEFRGSWPGVTFQS